MAERSATTATVDEARRELDAEHEQLHSLVEGIGRSTEAGGLAQLLNTLRQALHAHFEREEQPGGLYDRLGACSARLRDQVRVLVDEHYRIMGTVRGLHSIIEGGAGGGEVREREWVEQAHKLAQWLKEHEQRERALADSAMMKLN